MAYSFCHFIQNVKGLMYNHEYHHVSANEAVVKFVVLTILYKSVRFKVQKPQQKKITFYNRILQKLQITHIKCYFP